MPRPPRSKVQDGVGWVGTQRPRNSRSSRLPIKILCSVRRFPQRKPGTSQELIILAHVPVIGVDIWEHAFYLQYKNVKPDVSGFFLEACRYAEEVLEIVADDVWGSISRLFGM